MGTAGGKATTLKELALSDCVISFCTSGGTDTGAVGASPRCTVEAWFSGTVTSISGASAEAIATSPASVSRLVCPLSEPSTNSVPRTATIAVTVRTWNFALLPNCLPPSLPPSFFPPSLPSLRVTLNCALPVGMEIVVSSALTLSSEKYDLGANCTVSSPSRIHTVAFEFVPTCTRSSSERAMGFPMSRRIRTCAPRVILAKPRSMRNTPSCA